MINISQIGCGSWGPNLLRNFVQNNKCIVKTVVDVDDERLNYVKNLYPHIKISKNFEDIIKDDAIDAVVISTSASSHYEITEKVIKSGKHVLVEKPLALKTSEVLNLIKLSEKHNKKLMVGHTFEYNSAVHSLKNYIVNDELGEIYYIYSQRLNLGKIRKDVNSMWNLAIHDISILLYLLESEPVLVTAKGVSYIQENIEDVAFVIISFENNVVAHIHVSWLDPNKVRKMTVVGSKKMIVYDDVSDHKIQIFDKGIDKKSIDESLGEYDDFGKFQLIHRAGDIFIPKIKFEEPLKIESEHFINCIINDEEPLSGGYDGLRVINILETAQKSIAEKGKEILIPKV